MNKIARTAKLLDHIIYFFIILIPFFMSIAPAPVNVFEGFLLVAFLAKKALKKEKLFASYDANIPLLFLFLITCLSMINSVSYMDTLKGGIFKLFRYILVFLIVAEEVKGVKQIKTVILAAGLGIVLASIDGFWQVFTGKDFIRGYIPVINIGLVRATASFKDSNLLGIYLSALTPLIFGLVLFLRGKKKALTMAVSLVALTGIFLTYSRPTLLAVYAALFFLGIARKNKKLVSFLIILTLLAPFIAPRSVKNWAKEVDYNFFRFMCNDDRIAVYRNSLNMIKDHPVIGLGANTYMKSYKKYREPVEYRNVITKDHMYAHNNFIHMAAEIGLAGLAVFIWFLYALFRQIRRIYKKLDDPFIKTVSLSLTACLIAFLANGLTESSLYYSRVALIFWYISGLSLSLNKFAYDK
ncbi:MAG: O-antigen ligase family protein [Candidatus Omnitrophica bacterium]|nr:O-antigen ligase family protein [Candidatus Omnitrophota bacterium]MDD5552689.1 O-antigen ligase family protein [Candidatus Omnitrophota bacterium]